MREAMVYVPSELGPPGPDAPAWVERIKGRLAKPGARMLFDLLMDCAGGSIGRAIRGSHGWLAHCFTNRWVEERPGLDPRDYPSPQVYRRALAEVLSAGLVRVVGRGDRCEFWLLAPLRAPPQQELPLDPPDDLDEAPAVSVFRPRLYNPDEETNNDVRPVAHLPAVRAAALVESRPAEPLPSAPSLAPIVAKPSDAGASWLAEYRAARQAQRPAAAAGEAAAPPDVRQDAERSVVAHAARPQARRAEGPAPPHQGQLGAKVAAPTSTSLSKSTCTQTLTWARGPTPVGDSAGRLMQELLPLDDSLAETPRRAIELLVSLRRIDPYLYLSPVVTIRCAVDLGQVDEAKVNAVIACAERGVDLKGKPLGNVGKFVIDEWKKLVKDARLNWLAVAPPKVRREADRLAAEQGIAVKPERGSAIPAAPPAAVGPKRSAAAERIAATRRMMASWENSEP